MKILAGSITELADTFLHFGYGSASPRYFGDSWLNDKEPVVTLDMVEALRLKGEVLGAALPTGSGGEAAVGASVSMPVTTIVVGLVCAAAGVASVYLAHRRRRDRWGPAPPILAGALSFFFAVGLLGGGARDAEAGRTMLPPWAGVERQQYATPHKATLSLLYGILVDAVSDTTTDKIRSLAQVRDEVGLTGGKPERSGSIGPSCSWPTASKARPPALPSPGAANRALARSR
jgi:hypothetical protein